MERYNGLCTKSFFSDGIIHPLLRSVRATLWISSAQFYRDKDACVWNNEYVDLLYYRWLLGKLSACCSSSSLWRAFSLTRGRPRMKVIRIIDTTYTMLRSRQQLSLIALNDILSPVERAHYPRVSLEKWHLASVLQRSGDVNSRGNRIRAISRALIDTRIINLSPARRRKMIHEKGGNKADTGFYFYKWFSPR